MKKTMFLFKKLIAFVLSISIIYGYSITPVMALENNQSLETENKEIISTEAEEITDKVTEETDGVSLISASLEEVTNLNSENLEKASNLLETAKSYAGNLNSIGITTTDYQTELSEYEDSLKSISDDDSLTELIDEITSKVNEIKGLLKTNLSKVYEELSEKITSNTELEMSSEEVDANKDSIASEESETGLNELTQDYLQFKSDYNNAVSKYITNGIQSNLEENINAIFDTTLTAADYEKISSNIKEESKSLLDDEIDIDTLKSILNDDIEIDEIDDEILTAFKDLNNNKVNIIKAYESLKLDEAKLKLNGDTLNIDEEFAYTLRDYIANNLYDLKYNETTKEEQDQIIDKINVTEPVVDLIIEKLSLEETEVVSGILSEIKATYNIRREFFEASFNSNLSSLKVNDIELDLEELEQTIYVGNDITKLNLEYIPQEEGARVSVSDNAYDLQVGENIITICVYAPNGMCYKVYTLTVIREEAKTEAVVAPVVTNTETPKVVQLNNISNDNYSYTEEEVKEDKDISNTSDSSDKYNEEIEEESSLSWWIVLIIVILIAVIAFIIYKLFGDKDDQNFDKNFMKNNKSQSKNNKVNKNKK